MTDNVGYTGLRSDRSRVYAVLEVCGEYKNSVEGDHEILNFLFIELYQESLHRYQNLIMYSVTL